MNRMKTIFKNESGAALPLVLALMIIMTLLSITAMNIAGNNTTLASRFFSSEKSLYAAEKGYNQYLWKLNNDAGFYLDADNYNCDTTSEAGFYIYSPITDEGENYRVQIRIPVINDTPVSNQAFIRSTGWNKNDTEQQRTVEVEVLRRSFTQYSMISNSENTASGEKAIWYQKDQVFGPIHTNGTFYLYNKLLDGDNATFWSEVTYGEEIRVIDADTLNIISNDSVLNDPNIFKKGHMQMQKPLQFPGNAELQELRVLAKTNGHYYDGRTCIYLNGDSYDVRYYDRATSSWYFNNQRYRLYPRSVPNFSLIDWSANSERATILTEWKTEASDRVLYQALNEDNDVIGNYNSFNDFVNNAPNTISFNLPDNGIIFIDGMQGDGTHPYPFVGSNYELLSKYKPEMANVFVSGKLDGRLTIVSANDIYITGHNPTDWRHPDKISSFNSNSPGLAYSSPDPFYTNQIVGGQFTETIVNGENEMLGLIANRNVHVLRWNWPSQISHVIGSGDRFFYNWGDGPVTLSTLDFFNFKALDTAPSNITIHGAIFAIEGSFGLETNFRSLKTLTNNFTGFFSSLSDITSKKGQMKIFGSIGQKFREHSTRPPHWGELNLGSYIDGYDTIFTHDPRMKNDMPPHFVSPIKSGWYSIHWEEVNAHIPGD